MDQVYIRVVNNSHQLLYSMWLSPVTIPRKGDYMQLYTDSKSTASVVEAVTWKYITDSGCIKVDSVEVRVA